MDFDARTKLPGVLGQKQGASFPGEAPRMVDSDAFDRKVVPHGASALGWTTAAWRSFAAVYLL